MMTPDEPGQGHRRSGRGGRTPGTGRPPAGSPDRRQDPRLRRGGSGDASSRETTDRIGAAREPIGRDRAQQRAGAPPRPSRREAQVPRPDLPKDEEPQLPRGVIKEIERALGRGPRADDVALALSIGAAAIDEDRPDVALEVLAWAKGEAPRIATIREAYGVALYHGERYAEAATELQAYRRLTGRSDQNHVLADCLRALGREVDRVAETAGELVRDDQAPMDRRAEAAIVWAASLADAGDVAGGRAVLRRFVDRHEPGGGDHDLRLLYLLGDLAERDGDPTEARRWFARVHDADAGLLDVGDRLDALDA